MTAFDVALLRLAEWAGLSERRQRELLADARLSAAGPRSGPVRELWSVVGLGLQMRSHRATSGDAVRTFRQGARLGAALALVCALPLIVSASVATNQPALLALLVGPSAAWLAPSAHMARVTVLAAATIGVLELARTGGADPLVITLLLVAHGGLAIGDGEPWRSTGFGMRCATLTVVALGALAGLATVLDPSVVEPAVQVLGAGIIPATLLLVGRLDPRLAVAATSVVVARFGTFDRADLAALSGGGADVGPVVFRCLLMVSFVAAGALASRSAIRHHASL